LTPDHCDMYNRLQTAQLRPGYVTLSAAALAARLGMSRRQAERLIAATAAAQHDPTALRVVRLPVRIGSGAKRDALHILWPDPSSLTSHDPPATDRGCSPQAS
jgi:hypothetical protein